MLTSKWEVSTGCLIYNFIVFTQVTQKFVINSYNGDIETNLSNGKHTLRVFAWYFEEIVGKSLFQCFINVFVFICCISCFFYVLCGWTQRCGLLSRIHLRVTDPSWQTDLNESVLLFEIVFVVCWNQNKKLVQVVTCIFSVIFSKLLKLWS